MTKSTTNSDSWGPTDGPFLGLTPPGRTSSVAPFALAKAVYWQEPCARSFEEDLDWHLKTGYVVSRPEFFAMARPVDKNAAASLIVNPGISFSKPDCWHIWLVAGDMMMALDALPFPLPFISFERNNKLKVYEYRRFLRRCEALCQSNPVL